MIKASIVLALAGAAVLSASLGGVDLPLYLPISTFALAGLLYASLGIPKFLRIFQVMLGVAHLRPPGPDPRRGRRPHHRRLSRLRAATVLASRRHGLCGDHLRPQLRAGRPDDLPDHGHLPRIPGGYGDPCAADRQAARAGKDDRLDLRRHPDRHQPRASRPQRPPQLLSTRSVQRPSGQGCRRLLVSALRRVHSDRRRLRPRRADGTLSSERPDHPLAQVSELPLRRRMAGRGRPLPDADYRRTGRQPGSAHLQISENSSRTPTRCRSA